MSKKKLALLIVAVVIVILPVTAYVRTTYVWAQNSLTQSRLDIRTLGERFDRHDPADMLKDAYKRARFQVDQTAKHHSTWISRSEIDSLNKSLEQYKQDLDRIDQQK